MHFLHRSMSALRDTDKRKGNQLMKLSEVKAGSAARVVSLGTDRRFVNRITSIGMSEGVGFEVVKNDRNMPVLIYVRETLLALNRDDCGKIEVEVES